MRKQAKKDSQILNIIKSHVEKNLKEYLTVSILFVIGVTLGVMLANHIQIQIQDQIGEKISTCVNELKSGYEIDYNNILKSAIRNYILYTLLLWFSGCSVIGIPIVYLAISYKGLSLGYTISSIILALGTSKGILFTFITLFMQSIFSIPAFCALAVSSINLYKSIIKNKRMENIKLQIIKHTVFSIFTLAILICTAFIETHIQIFLLKLCIKNL